MFDHLWDYGQPALSEQRFRELLPRTEGQPGLRAELLTQIARAQGLQRRFDEAHLTLDGAAALLAPELARATVRYQLERGRLFNSGGDRPQSRGWFLRAAELAGAAGEEALAIDALHMLGIVDQPADQIRWNLEALERAERASDPEAQRWRASLANNLGWTYHGLGQFDAALAMFEKAVLWRRERGQPAEERIARWAVARALRSLGRIDEAYAMQRQLLDEHAAAGGADGYVFEELAECALLRGEPGPAARWFAEAHRLLSQDAWLAEREPQRLERMQALAAA